MLKEESSDLEFSNFKLYQLGILVHAAMLLLVLLLPPKNVMEVYQTISLTVIGIYPLATLLIGRILLDQEISNNSIKKLSESEKLLSTTLYSIGDGVITTDTKGKIVTMNSIAEQLTGWTENRSL